MLSGSASSASQWPRRTKSTPLVQTQATVAMAPSPCQVKNTYQQALAAANLAFERASDRATAKQGPHEQDRRSTENNDGEPKLEKRQSVRFTGVTAIPLRNRSITRREAPGYRTDNHPYESQSDVQSHDIELSGNDRASAALVQQVGEFGESDNASVPSSYRKLRKAKSMFSPGKAPSAVFSDGVACNRRHFHHQSLQSSHAYRESLSLADPPLRKSYSFLRGVTERLSTGSRQDEANDAAVQLARDQYLRQLEQQRMKEQPSLLGLGNHRKSQRAFRRTVRTSSTNSYGSAIASPLASVETPTVKDLGRRARSFSQTIKKKIKRVFKRDSDTEGIIPVQQIKASHPHYGDYILTSNGNEQRYPPVPEPDAELLLRVGSRESVNCIAAAHVENGGRPDSKRSAQSDDDEGTDKSRVTSWTDSTAANTINIPQTLERKRLSVIKEDGGPHQPSSSARHYEGTSNGYASFRQPVRQSSAGRVTGPIDPKRIFSALQKKIDENNRRAALDNSESGTDCSSSYPIRPPSERTPKRTSSIHKGAKAKSGALSRSDGANVPTSVVSSSLAVECFNDHFYQYGIESSNQDQKQQDSTDLQKGLTLQQFAETNEHRIPRPKRPLREVKSAFFPPSTRIERSNLSPYRRAMHASSENEAESPSRTNHRDRPPSERRSGAVTDRLRNGSVAESVSIYSGSSGGDFPKATGSSTSLAMSESSAEAGTAIITTAHPCEHEQSAYPAAMQHGYSSVASSGNWRNFMATQVASFEDFGTHQEQIDDTIPIKDSGHRRENAQVNSDEVNVGRLQSSCITHKQPLAIIQGKPKASRGSKYKISYPLGDRPPLRSIGHSVNAANVKEYENAPMHRTPEASRMTSNAENDRRALSHAFESSGGLREQNSHSSLKMQTGRRNSPTAASPRNSPERAERLRRLKSSSGSSLGKPLSKNKTHVSRRNSSSDRKIHGLDGSDKSPSAPQSQAGNHYQLVNSFLKNRRSVMRTSEDSGTDPAFL